MKTGTPGSTKVLILILAMCVLVPLSEILSVAIGENVSHLKAKLPTIFQKRFQLNFHLCFLFCFRVGLRQEGLEDG